MYFTIILKVEKKKTLGDYLGRYRIPIKNVYEWDELAPNLVFTDRRRGISEFQTFLADLINE